MSTHASILASAGIFEMGSSYARANQPLVENLAEDVEGFGYRVWFDQQLTGGHDWWNSILASIRRSDVFLFALTPDSLNSYPCRMEYEYAHALGKRILPVMIETVDPSLLPEALSQVQFVDYRESAGRNGPIRLGRAFNSLPPARPLPDPLPEPPSVPVSNLGRLKELVENNKELTLQEQSALFLELKGFYLQPASQQSARQILLRLQDRSDSFARVDREIEALLKPQVAVEPSPQPISPPPAIIQPTSKPVQAASIPRATPKPKSFDQAEISDVQLTSNRIQSGILWMLSATVSALVFLSPIVTAFRFNNSEEDIKTAIAVAIFAFGFLSSILVPAELKRRSSNNTQVLLVLSAVTIVFTIAAVLILQQLEYGEFGVVYLPEVIIYSAPIFFSLGMSSWLPVIRGHLWRRIAFISLIGFVSYLPILSYARGIEFPLKHERVFGESYDYFLVIMHKQYIILIWIAALAIATSFILHLPEVMRLRQLESVEKQQ